MWLYNYIVGEPGWLVSVMVCANWIVVGFSDSEGEHLLAIVLN